MNIKLITALAATAGIFSSCTPQDPEYAQWKAQQQAQQANNPYGVPGASSNNPYGVPGQNGETAGQNAPYQTLPNVPSNPPNIPVPDSNVGQAPELPSGGTINHKVVAGDSLWRLARDNNTTVEKIQQANGISDTNIRTGQTLIIPTN